MTKSNGKGTMRKHSPFFDNIYLLYAMIVIKISAVAGKSAGITKV